MPLAGLGPTENVRPNPSIERTSQRPLRALWAAAHVERLDPTRKPKCFTPVLEAVAYVSYSQILVFDSSISAPGLHWTDRHFAQGFARQASVVSLRHNSSSTATLISQSGSGKRRQNYPRIPECLQFPFESFGELVSIEGPEEFRNGVGVLRWIGATTDLHTCAANDR
jgi:hypothetical protein